MEPKLLFVLGAFLIVSTGTAFAQTPLTVQTDSNHYDEGDAIVVSGKVAAPIEGVDVILRLYSNGNLIEVAQRTVAQDGTYTHTILAEGPLWKKSATIEVKASYETAGIIEAGIEFKYTSGAEVTATTTNFVVDAGSHGTFDVEYTIRGGTVNGMIVNSDIFGLVVKIDATDDGTVTLDLPREFIGAEKQDGKDDIFIVLIDGVGATYEESVVLADSREITIDFKQGDSDISIIGTYVLPEFGAAVMFVLIAGIITIILFTRSRFQIKI